jgi:transcription elongation factor GreA-like protein/transcription elongation GreA/GreB family factor
MCGISNQRYEGLIMSYLKEFLTQIQNRDFHKFLILWEEYCTSEVIETEELNQLLKAIKSSDLAKHFGQIVETSLPLWKTIQDPIESYEILRLLIDLQTTNSPELAEIAFEALQKTYGSDPKFNDRIRLIGLREKENFQGAISKYDLLMHMFKGNIVFHTGGWGTGEIIEVSFVRENLSIEFENVGGRKDLSFANGFKTLIPLADTHFLAQRFSNPDKLEEKARENPVAVIKLLLHDLGPKTASEIKDEFCDLVIPAKDWPKWWQGARAKSKKDPIIETPESLKHPFYLRKYELSSEDRLKQKMLNKTDVNEVIEAAYHFARNTAAKSAEAKQSLQQQLTQLLELPEITENQEVQIHLLLEQFFNYEGSGNRMKELIKNHQHLEQLIQAIDIVAFKKCILLAIKEHREDWQNLFLNLLFILSQTQLRDYLLRELNKPATNELLKQKLNELLLHPQQYPDLFFWYFQKLVDQEKEIPFQDIEGRCQFFDAFFIVLYSIENQIDFRELNKKMYSLLTQNRYALVRQFLEKASLEFVKEFLLLASKCQTLTNQDMKVLRSLTEVVYPSLAAPKHRRENRSEQEKIWTTEEGYLKTQERIMHIGTVEIIENAEEIKNARALGDLRENSEFKFAQERRARLQSELKTLSDQLKNAHIISANDVRLDEVDVGNIVELADSNGQRIHYTILGPWDANPEINILSFNSKFAQAMIGKKKGDTVDFRDNSFKVMNISSYFTK